MISQGNRRPTPGTPPRLDRSYANKSLEIMCVCGISGAPESSNASTEATTGVPNKSYRGAQQGSPSASRPLTPLRRANKPKTRPLRPSGTPPSTYRGPQQGLPGCPTSTTGVSDKNHRGLRQKLPGCPTSTTGVPNKKYRGAQQVPLSKIAAK
jgi:hypothetical protein